MGITSLFRRRREEEGSKRREKDAGKNNE